MEITALRFTPQLFLESLLVCEILNYDIGFLVDIVIVGYEDYDRWIDVSALTVFEPAEGMSHIAFH